MNIKTLIIVLVVFIIALLGGGGGVFWWMHKQNAAAGKNTAAPVAEVEEVVDEKDLKYLTLEKCIVMLRQDDGTASSHFLMVDLVFKIKKDREELVKEQLPYLRSLTVGILSRLTVQKAGAMSTEQYRQLLRLAFKNAYAASHQDKPYLDVLIGKLIIE